MRSNGLLPPASESGYFQGNVAAYGSSLYGGGQGNSTMPYNNQCQGVAAL